MQPHDISSRAPHLQRMAHEGVAANLIAEEVVPLDASGNATGRFAGYVRILKSLGDEAGQPFAALVAGPQ